MGDSLWLGRFARLPTSLVCYTYSFLPLVDHFALSFASRSWLTLSQLPQCSPQSIKILRDPWPEKPVELPRALLRLRPRAILFPLASRINDARFGQFCSAHA